MVLVAIFLQMVGYTKAIPSNYQEMFHIKEPIVYEMNI